MSFIHPEAELASDVEVGHASVIESGARLGAGVVVGSGAFIGTEVIVGEGSFIGPGAVLLPGCEVGAGCIIGAGAVLGSRGYGYVEDQGEHVPIPQVGKVIVESGVQIGSGSCIDRATTAETRVGQDSRLGSLVQVAHNVVIGSRVQVGPHCGLAGSSVVGADCRLGAMSGTIGHSVLGENCVLEPGCGLTRRKIAAGSHLHGHPARPIEEWKAIEEGLETLLESL